MYMAVVTFIKAFILLTLFFIFLSVFKISHGLFKICHGVHKYDMERRMETVVQTVVTAYF